MDARYHALRAACEYEGLTPDERTAALDYLEAPATQAANMATLLRGALADRGNLLDQLKAARLAGLAAGRVLLSDLLANHSQCLSQPHAPIAEPEWAAGRAAMNAPDLTCDQLLAMLLKTRRVIAYRQRLATKAA